MTPSIDPETLILMLRRGKLSPRDAAEIVRGKLLGEDLGEATALIEAFMRGVDRALVEEIAANVFSDEAVRNRVVEETGADEIIGLYREKPDEALARLVLLEFLYYHDPVAALASSASIIEKITPLLRRGEEGWRRLFEAVVNGPLSQAPPKALSPILDLVLREMRNCCFEEKAALASMILNNYAPEILCSTETADKLAELLAEMAEEIRGEATPSDYRIHYLVSLYRMLRNTCSRAGAELPEKAKEADKVFAELGKRLAETSG